VAEAGEAWVEISLPAQGRDGAVPVDVKTPRMNPPVQGARDGVPGEQDAVVGQVDGDAARGVAGYGDGLRATAEVQRVPLVEFPCRPVRAPGSLG